MKNINEIMREYGVTVPEDKTEAFNKAVNENYKTIVEFDKKVAKLELERDTQKERADSAEATLKSFDGVDVEAFKKQIADANEKAEQIAKDYESKIYDRDFADAIAKSLEGTKFTSTYAKDAVIKSIKDSGLKLSEGKILGLNDLLTQLKEKDPTAFVDDKQAKAEASKAKFTTPTAHPASGKTMTKEEILAIKDRNERRIAMVQNKDLFPQLKG